MHKPKILNDRSPRKVLHAVLGLVMVGLVYWLSSLWSLKAVLLIGVFVLIILIVIDMVRIEYKAELPMYSDLLKRKEKMRFNALIFSVAAGLLVLGVFPFEIAISALLMAVLGDPIASLVGRKYGKHKIPFNKAKSIQGTVANLAVCLIIGIIMLYSHSGKGISVGILMAIVATLTELFSDKTEDNFTIPLFAAAAGQLMWWMF